MLEKFYKHALVFFILAICCFGTYHNAFHQFFLIDDNSIFGDPVIKTPKYIAYSFIPDKNKYLEINGQRRESHYRPLTYAFYGVSYHLFGTHPPAYHLMNVILLALLCFFIYFFMVYLCKDFLIGFLTAVFFAVHPVHGLLVNYITASVFVFQVAAMLLCVWFFLKARESADGVKSGFYWSSVFFLIIALLFHETSIGLPLYIFCILFFYYRDPLKQIVFRLIPLCLLLGVYLLIRMQYASLKVSVLDSFHTMGIGPLEYLASFSKIFFWYVTKLFYPIGVVLIWGTPVVKQNIFLWISAFVVFLGMCFIVIRKTGKGLVPMSMAWFLVGFLPVGLACMFSPASGFMMEPHWVIFSSLGFFLLLAIGFKRVLVVRPFLGKVLFVALMSFWMFIASVNNAQWSDPIRYCRYWLSQAPQFKSVDFYLAGAYLEKKQYDLAKKHYQNSLAGVFTDYQAYNNLGLIDFYEGEFDKSIENYQKGLIWNPASAALYNNLGEAYRSTGRIVEAKETFDLALRANYFYVEPRINLAQIAVSEGDIYKATRLYRQNLEFSPFDKNSTFQLIPLLLKQRGETPKAFRVAQKFIGHSDDPVVLTEFGSFLAEAKMVSVALEAYEKAMQLDPKYKEVYLEAGKLMGNLRKYDIAVDIWNKGQQLDLLDNRFAELIGQANQLKSSVDK